MDYHTTNLIENFQFQKCSLFCSGAENIELTLKFKTTIISYLSLLGQNKESLSLVKALHLEMCYLSQG